MNSWHNNDFPVFIFRSLLRHFLWVTFKKQIKSWHIIIWLLCSTWVTVIRKNPPDKALISEHRRRNIPVKSRVWYRNYPSPTIAVFSHLFRSDVSALTHPNPKFTMSSTGLWFRKRVSRWCGVPGNNRRAVCLRLALPCLLSLSARQFVATISSVSDATTRPWQRPAREWSGQHRAREARFPHLSEDEDHVYRVERA